MSAAPLPPARGILHPQTAPGRFEHRRLAPADDLAAFVEHHWFVRWSLPEGAEQVQETLPHPNVHLVVEDGRARLWGVQRARFTKRMSGEGAVYGLKFRVAAFGAFFPDAVAALTDRELDAREVFGDRVQALCDPALAFDLERRRELGEALLRDCSPRIDDRAIELGRMVQRIMEDPTLVSVDALSERTGEHIRRLQRDFRQHVGVSPKWVIARYRLHEAVALLQRGEARPDADLALRLGYFDQAHFIRDFRRLVGCAPAAYARSLAVTSAT